MLSRGLAAAVLAFGLVVASAGAGVPSDPLAGSWIYSAVDLPAAWEVTAGSPEVVIAVVDSGVEAAHPDLAGAVEPGYDFVDDDADAADAVGHGTAVAGIAAARGNNGLGAAGACWRCRILPLRVLGPDGFAYYSRQARAIDYAVERGAAVVNLSLYGESRDPRLEDAVHRARAAGVVVVAAAGNERGSTREYPAALPDAISVGATVEAGRLAAYSGRGDWVKVAAPACAPTTHLGGGYGPGCGTSGATPLVAGVTAQIDAFAALKAAGSPAPRLAATIVGLPYVGGRLSGYDGVWAGARVGAAYRWIRCRAPRMRRRDDRGHRLDLHDPRTRPRSSPPPGRHGSGARDSQKRGDVARPIGEEDEPLAVEVVQGPGAGTSSVRSSWLSSVSRASYQIRYPPPGSGRTSR
jgi:subtilisin family serine protease